MKVTKQHIVLGIMVLLITTAALIYFGMKNHTKSKLIEVENVNDSINMEIDTNSVSLFSDIDSIIIESELSKTKYHLVVGSFLDVENAKKLQYVYDGSKILPITEDGYHRVSILEYDNYSDCNSKAKSFSENNGKVWILKVQ